MVVIQGWFPDFTGPLSAKPLKALTPMNIVDGLAKSRNGHICHESKQLELRASGAYVLTT